MFRFTQKKGIKIGMKERRERESRTRTNSSKKTEMGYKQNTKLATQIILQNNKMMKTKVETKKVK